MTTALILADIQNDYFPGGKNELDGQIEASLCARHQWAGLKDHCPACVRAESPLT